jgi:hypothetical protein
VNKKCNDKKEKNKKNKSKLFINEVKIYKKKMICKLLINKNICILWMYIRRICLKDNDIDMILN